MVLYIVTDRTWLGNGSLKDQVEQALKQGATFVQLREKELQFDAFVEIATQIKTVTDRYKVPFVINDCVEVALAVDSDGVHIGQSDEGIIEVRKKLGKDKIIGVSAHNVTQAREAQQKGADYIGVGAVFNTTTKHDANTVTFETLKAICQAVTIPVVAIGGINKDNILKLSGSGVDGVAVVSAVFAQPDIGKATEELSKLSKQMVEGNVKR